MSTRDLLVEIGTEELPPKALGELSRSFENSIKSGLRKELLEFSEIKSFATPRRLALLVLGLEEQQSDKHIERFGPALAAAFTAENKPTAAAVGFAKSCGVDISQLGTAKKDGIEKLSYTAIASGGSTGALLPEIVNKALAQLPIPKRMRWGSSREEFVRPVHWTVLLFGEESISTAFLGVKTDSFTIGHRFHYNKKIPIQRAADYEKLLESIGSVIPDFDKRRKMIRQLIAEEAARIGATVVVDEDLLNEVTSLVEYPVVLSGKFEEIYLDVPSEALIMTMKSHQKCFYLIDAQSNLLPRFIAISNIRSTDLRQVVEGNERVIRPRLADARFFFESDKQSTLYSRVERLKNIIFQQRLGSLHEKSERVGILAAHMSKQLNASPEYCARAALLSKCDLITSMVGEFADLQGLMGYYYALNDGEPLEVATALNEQYKPRFAGDTLPETITGCILAIADKLDSIVGLFAIGQPPTGSKDPFALRRAAIGILRVLVERELNLNILECIDIALKGYKTIKIGLETRTTVFDFLLERFRAWYLEEGISSSVFQSVFAVKPQQPLDFHRRISAVHRFNQLEQSETLAAANKRVSNLLAKLGSTIQTEIANPTLLEAPAERSLYEALARVKVDACAMFDAGDYTQGLDRLATLRDDVDRFFDQVLVMCEDPRLQANRIALLVELRNLFLRVADISYLHSS